MFTGPWTVLTSVPTVAVGGGEVPKLRLKTWGRVLLVGGVVVWLLFRLRLRVASPDYFVSSAAGLPREFGLHDLGGNGQNRDLPLTFRIVFS